MLEVKPSSIEENHKSQVTVLKLTTRILEQNKDWKLKLSM
jgi:hypothetical protein